MAKKIEMIGKRFGRLTVISEGNIDGEHQCAWVCRCDCGNITKPIRGTTLRNGKSLSCGCLRTELVKERFTKHGKCDTKTYYVWRGIRSRCLRKTDDCFERYGGRGITVYEEWRDNYQAFYDYVSQLPHFGESGYSLDRIDNSGNYEPGNVRWATPKEQANNKRDTIYITVGSEKKTISQISAETGFHHSTIYRRYRAGRLIV